MEMQEANSAAPIKSVFTPRNARGLERTGRRESRKNVYLTNAPKNETSPYCGHVFDVHRTPRKSCTGCWDFFFTVNAEHTKNLMVAVTGGYWREIKANYGSEYLKQIERFVAAVKAQQEFAAREKAFAEKLGLDYPLPSWEDEKFNLQEMLNEKFTERTEAQEASA